MLKRLNPFVLSGETEEELALSNWSFDSHNWKEWSPGYFECQWCRVNHTSTQGWGSDRNLCLENPIVKRMMNAKIQ